MGQTERELGVQSHLKKNGTPTMGGVIFLIATTVTSLFYIKDYPMIIPRQASDREEAGAGSH